MVEAFVHGISLGGPFDGTLHHYWCTNNVVILFYSQPIKLEKYFLTALIFFLAMANVFGFSPAVTHWYISSRVRSFCCSSVIFSGGTCSKLETAFKVLTISSLSSSTIIDCTAQLMFCASCLRSSEIFVLLTLIYGLTDQWIWNYFHFITIGLTLALDVTWWIEWTAA